MEFKSIDWYGNVITNHTSTNQFNPASWPCNSCGVTLSGPPKGHVVSAGKGIHMLPGYAAKKELDTPSKKIKVIQTKAGPMTIITKHIPNEQ